MIGFASYSLVAIYSAMAVYALAFVFFTLDLAKRAAAPEAAATDAVGARAGQAATARAAAEARATRTATAVVEGENPYVTTAVAGGVPGAATRAADPAAASAPRTRFERGGFALLVLGWLLHLGGAVLRGLATGHVPWANMFEFSLVSSLAGVGVYLLVTRRLKLGWLAAYVTGAGLTVLGTGTVNFYVEVTPLAVPLQSVWIVIHVLVAILATAFFSLGAGLSIVQLLQARREQTGRGFRFLRTVPNAEKVETLAYRTVVIGFVFWTFTLIAGAIWAERAWGRFWGWDTKEVWTFVIWVLYAGYIHARATRGWRGSRSAWLSLIGFGAVIFNYTIVNLFFAGLHSYSGL